MRLCHRPSTGISTRFHLVRFLHAKRAFPLVASPGILAKAPEEVLPPPPRAPAVQRPHLLPLRGNGLTLEEVAKGSRRTQIQQPAGSEPGAGSSFLGDPAVQAEVLSGPATLAAVDATSAEPPKRSKSSKITERFAACQKPHWPKKARRPSLLVRVPTLSPGSHPLRIRPTLRSYRRSSAAATVPPRNTAPPTGWHPTLRDPSEPPKAGTMPALPRHTQ